MTTKLGTDVRRLRYRLKRQGMLELDAWLSGLDGALLSKDMDVIVAMNDLLLCEVPVLLEIMHGDMPMPDILRAYLGKC
ncbi:MAG: succinate dehydrogenase assembly factor 2 [Mariprofundaceae bacterium]|nr:succinate dehydrogenase assembly factor 2 [Mariprofundaceae bacterium]